ncbi:MAG TPA: hypothetical protein PLY88_00065 [Candidatus Omnitrophota bacterium]|mgnify:CR=1 FL=1|nr:hypothetical protein [Candidatus Omnitrophota bacterium]
MKLTAVLFFLMTAFAGFARAEESPKPEYVWVEPAEETPAPVAGESKAETNENGAPGFSVKPVF